MKQFPRSLGGTILLSFLANAAPAAAAEVSANDSTDLYEISGAVILDASHAEAHAAATCTNCHWRIIHTCASGPLEDRRNCLGLPCPTAQGIAEVWRADAVQAPSVGDALWTYRGLVCLTAPPAAVMSITSAVEDLALRAVPPLKPVSQPGSTTLAGLATLFSSRQPTAVHTDPAFVGGLAVIIHTVPTWTWDFGHGPVLTTTDPGGPWPTGHVRHTYLKRGIFRVRVTSTWRATYEVRGITDLPVDGVITQSAWFDLRVREARRFLQKPKGA